RLADVIIKILARLFNGLPHIGVSCKVDYCLNVQTFNSGSHEQPVGNIADYERSPFHGPTMAGAQIIEDNRVEAGGGKRLAGMAANIPGPARHQDAHTTLTQDTTPPTDRFCERTIRNSYAIRA